jgi:hypothetical protein
MIKRSRRQNLLKLIESNISLLSEEAAARSPHSEADSSQSEQIFSSRMTVSRRARLPLDPPVTFNLDIEHSAKNLEELKIDSLLNSLAEQEESEMKISDS